jgi:hypothetical protein
MAIKPEEPKIIPFADNLLESLPKSYLGNLALLPLEQRAAIDEDARRWRLANTMFEKRMVATGLAQITKANRDIVDGLNTMEPAGYREDMRRRLNILKGKLK